MPGPAPFRLLTTLDAGRTEASRLLDVSVTLANAWLGQGTVDGSKEDDTMLEMRQFLYCRECDSRRPANALLGVSTEVRVR